MNILVFSWRDPKHPLAGGAEQVMHEHMKGWIAAGNKVTLFASRFPGSSLEEEIDGVQIIRQGYQYLGVQVAGFFYYQKNRVQFDFVVDQFHGLPFFTPLYIKKPKLAVIQETAGKVWFLNPLPWPINWLIGIIGYLGEPFIFLFYRSTLFMTGSASAKQDVTKFGIPVKNIMVVPHGVVIHAPKTKLVKEKIPTLIFLGVLSKDKGIEDALHCFALLKDQKFQFWVIGRPETLNYGKKIEALTEKLGLKNRVKFWGFVSQEKKFELLARAHLLINPSTREGWGLVNIEANFMGTPVIGYKSAGLIDSIKEGESGLFCEQNNPQELAIKIISFFANKERRASLQKGSLAWSKKFTWEKSKQLSLQLLHQLGNL